MLEKKCLGVRFFSRSCSEQTNHDLDRNFYVSPSSFCRVCQERLLFHAINKYFNSIDKSLIVNC